MKQQSISFQNKKLAVYSNGNVAKPAIVFIHGNSMSAKIWQKQFDDAALSANHHLLAFDLPGCGNSDNLDTYTLSLMADSVTAVITHFNLKDYILAGNSLGGDLILQLTDKLNHCKGLVITNTPPVGKPPAMDKALLPNPLVCGKLSVVITEKPVFLL